MCGVTRMDRIRNEYIRGRPVPQQWGINRPMMIIMILGVRDILK
jgi:hypothetical protein